MATGSGSSPAAGGPRTGPPAAPVPGPAQPMVAVWEWQDDAGCWRPYSGQVCRFIEQSLSHQRGWRGPGPSAGGSVSLGQADPSLAAYIIDIPSLKQFRQDTGKLRSVRQSLFPQSSALASGVFWEWASDEGGWTPYETRTSILLEHSYQARQATADLGPHGYNYIVDLTALLQVNKTSGFRRQVRRQASAPYPLASGPACTCQQCLSHGAGGGGGGGAGPVSSRSRHSFSAGQAARPALQPHGRGAPTLAYSPYSRRPLSMGHMSWGGPWNPATSAPAVGAGPAPSAAPSANGLSVPAVPLHLNGSSGVTSALAGMASILMSAAGLGVRFVSAGGPPRGRHGDVRRAKRPHRTGSHKSENVIQKYMEEVPAPPEEDCIICMERLVCPSGYEGASEGAESIQPSAVGKLTKCGHTLHMLCMLAMYNNGTKDGSLQCPSCKTIYGEKTGTQPKGKMEIYSISQSLPGHSDCGTIQIVYSIPPGIQGPEHPNPGQPYTCRGFPRYCFLPDNEKGRKVLELLKVAWTRRLIFTVGTSSTTGEPDTVVWNEIHHKTEMMSNVSGHGYPDPNYLDNVLAELAAQGVAEECLRRERHGQAAHGQAAHASAI